MADTKKLKLKINGMHCGSCAMLIDGDLEELEGVKSSMTNYYSQECEVEVETGRIEISRIIETVKKTGYKAEEAKS